MKKIDYPEYTEKGVRYMMCSSHYHMKCNCGEYVAVGDEAGAALISGTENTFMGFLSGRYTGNADHPDYNSGFGSRTLYACTTGERNVAMGAYALNALTTAADNVAIGYGALQTTNNTRNLGIG